MWKSSLPIGCAAMAVLLNGCAQATSIRTFPPGADVMFDGRPVGRSPLRVTVERDELTKPHTYRVDLPGYTAEEGTLATGVSTGRIIGTVFTLGILYIFRTPTYVNPVTVYLRPLANRGRTLGWGHDRREVDSAQAAV